jgi:hypothetical protein
VRVYQFRTSAWPASSEDIAPALARRTPEASGRPCGANATDFACSGASGARVRLDGRARGEARSASAGARRRTA